jgi:hypothetical protein
VGGSRKKMQLFLIFAKNVGEEGKYSSKVGGACTPPLFFAHTPSAPMLTFHYMLENELPENDTTVLLLNSNL